VSREDAKKRHGLACRRIGHLPLDHELREERDNLLLVAGADRRFAMGHVARLEDVAHYDVGRRAAPLDATVCVGIDAKLDSSVASPRVGDEDGAFHGRSSNVHDLHPHDVAWLHPERELVIVFANDYFLDLRREALRLHGDD
jgi:hypothetical protein